MRDRTLAVALAEIEMIPGARGPSVRKASRLPDDHPSLASVGSYADALTALFDFSGLEVVVASTGGPVSSSGSSRTIYVAGVDPVVEDVSERLGLERPAVALAVLEPDLVEKIPGMSPRKLGELVASDFGAVVSGYVGLKGEGAVVGMLPWLLALAGSVVAHRVSDSDVDVVDRAVTSVAHSFSQHLSPGGGNAFSRMGARHPDFLPILNVVGRNAYRLSAHLPVSKVPFRTACEIARRSVLEALGSAGVDVERSSTAR